MKIDNVTDGKIKLGSTTYTMQEAKYNGSVVWSRTSTVRYVITSATLYYGTDPERTSITAQAGNNSYAYVTGDVDVYENDVYVRTLTNRTLVPVVNSADFYVANTYYIRAYDLGTTPTSARKSTAVTATYNGATRSVGYVYQERNVRTVVSTGEKHYGTPGTPTNSDYTINYNPADYSSSATPCPASGDTVAFYAWHLQTAVTPWTRDVVCTYTARPNQTFTEQESGSDSISTTITDTPTISGSGTGFTVSGTTVTIANRGTTTGSMRSATFTVVNGPTTLNVTLYQEANVATTGPGAITSFSIDGNTSNFTVPSAAANYYWSIQGYRLTTYTSGATGEQTPATWNVISSDTTFATINSSLGRVEFTENTGSSSRPVTITVRDSQFASVSKSITITQSAAAHTWVLTIPSLTSVEYNQTSFYIDVYSTKDGSPHPITASNVFVLDSNIGATLQSVTTVDTATYRLTFSCLQNNTSDRRETEIRVSQSGGGLSKSATVRQYEHSTALDGIEVVRSVGEWVIGLIKTGETPVGGRTNDLKGIIVARRAPITKNTVITVGNLIWKWATPSAGDLNYTTYDDSGTDTVASGTTLTQTPYGGTSHTYYGRWLVSPSTGGQVTPLPNLTIDSIRVFAIQEL